MKAESNFQGILFESLFNHASIGIIVSDSKGNVFIVNDYALKMFQYEREELVNKSIEILIPMRFNHVPMRTNFEQKPQNRSMGMGRDLYGLKKSGEEFSVEISLSFFEMYQERYFIAFISDIHKRKKAELELKELNEDLERKVNERTQDLKEALDKEKVLGELKSRFVSIASHEFKTPLSTISSSAYLLSQYHLTQDQAKREKHIQRIQNSVNSLNSILDDFLSQGRIEEGKVQIKILPFDIEELMLESIQDFDSLLKSGQKIIYNHIGDRVILSDKSALKHIFQNLVSNALKFSRENSEVLVETTALNHTLTLKIQDFGIGIPKVDQTHLFERFYRAQNAMNIKGTGLGLHIVAKYVELLKGSIECSSEENKGTEFIILLENV